MAAPLITKYRPQSLEEVLGNAVAVKNLGEALKSNSCPHAFLFTGPSGIGKTTLARIIAKQVNASILEIDAATNSGIDDTRMLVERAQLRPVSIEPNLLYIIDECHAISSKNAWQPLLKLLEDPPSYLYVALCTTDAQKVPETIKTRCYPVALKALKPPELEDLIGVVSELEGWQVSNDTFQAIVQAADGSARRALSILQAGHACQNREELGTILAGVDADTNPAIELARFLLKGGRSWKQVSSLLEQIEEPEDACRAITSYLAAAMARSEEKQAAEIWRMITALSESQGTFDKRIQLFSGIGKILWG